MVLHWMSLPLSCSFDRGNPFDEGGPNYVPPLIIINEKNSSIRNLDTIHFDTVTIALQGNREESLFKLKIDNEVWTFDWHPAGIYGFGKLTEGAHTIYFNSMYDGGELVTSDSIMFYVLTKGYKPEFEKRNDTTITLFEGKELTLAAKAEGFSPLHYSWVSGIVVLEGKSNDSLKFTLFTVNDTASYRCIVTNQYGKDTSRTFLLRYRPFSGGIKGVVTDTSGNKLKNVTVMLYPSNNEDTTDSTGSFAFTSLSGNSYTLKINLPTYHDTALTAIAVTDTETVIIPTVKLKMIDTTIYRIEYHSNGSDSGTVPLATNKYIPGSKIAVAGSNNLSKVGYSFSKWNTQMDGAGNEFAPGDSFTVSGNVTFYAQWIVKQFTLSFNGNGNTSGVAPEIKKYDYHTTATVPDKGTLKRDGYTFSGWNTAQNGSGAAFSASDTFAMPASEMALYAQWIVLPIYKVTYDNNSADSGTVPVDSTSYYNGKEVTVAGNPGKLTRSSHSFSGWNTKADGTGESYNAGSKFMMPDSAVTLYVKWTTNPTYTVTYYGTTASGGESPAVVNADSGTQATISDSGSLYKTGYSFVGWNTKEDGSGKAYKSGDIINIGSINIGLYAQWTKAIYTITYYGNGNTWGTLPAKTTHLFQTEIIIESAGNLAKTGYRYVSWNTDSTGKGLDYHEGNRITIENNIKLYARWSKNKYKIKFAGNGDRVLGIADNIEYEYGHNIDSTTVIPSRLSYFFNGWFKDSLCNEKWKYSIDSVVSDDTLYAKWIITDTDGNIYTEVKIGNQVWMVENFKATKYNDGTPIPLVVDSAYWVNTATEAYCWYNNDMNSFKKYGAIYKWFTVSTGKLAPIGWHVPTNKEWDDLENYLIANGNNWDETKTGNKIAKSLAAKSTWVNDPTQGTPGNVISSNNSSGFSALAGGYRDIEGYFGSKDTSCGWWSSTVWDNGPASYAWYRYLVNCYEGFGKDGCRYNTGNSIRLIRD